MKKLYLINFMFVFSLLLTCCSKDKKYYLTDGNCKFWNLYCIKGQNGEIERKKSVSLKFCKEGEYEFFFLKNGRRKPFKADNFYNDCIVKSTNRWSNKDDLLIINSQYEGEIIYKIQKLTEKKLILKTMDEKIYYFNSSN